MIVLLSDSFHQCSLTVTMVLIIELLYLFWQIIAYAIKIIVMIQVMFAE